MSETDRIIVVIGATGQQGGAATKHLRQGGWRVRALVREPRSPKARALAEAGVELAAGDLNDRASLDAALRGAYGVFSVQPSAGQPQYGVTPEDEVRQGKSVADAARAAGVAHLVYTSVDGADDAGDAPHLASKWEIEEHIRALDLRATILRPASFMENFVAEGLGFSRGKVVYFGRPADPVPLIAADDIGNFAAVVFGDPATHAGTVLPLVGDVLTGAEIADALGRAAGRSIAYEPYPPEIVQHNPALGLVMAFVQRYHTRADIPALRRLHPGLLDFAAWLRTSGEPRLASLSRA
ncbi:NmrA/HSCARG family protein [Nannocystis radixulma]|uniref:NmrA/HSCARG family protein n=1 Tax=Nannocystis radixulma TaxID=2995305 RepID=A0ABT5B203_9BACT|nr:NmrA/HSCARG family protein [Nannocystis radixulma]MDC0668134.1 NmrA/HSCARG family protein [Nannocystis radixulma]